MPSRATRMKRRRVSSPTSRQLRGVSGARRRASDRGLVVVYYGDGKGKTTAALGAVLRAVGQGWRCAAIQFIKGPWPSSERASIPKYLGKLVTIEAGGKGFVGILDDRLPRAVHQREARKLYREVLRRFRAWARGTRDEREETRTGKRFPHPACLVPRLVVLDEILDAVELGFLSEAAVVRLIRAKPLATHLILTGHKRFPKILAAADLVTRMRKEKHPFDRGWLAIRGLDF